MVIGEFQGNIGYIGLTKYSRHSRYFPTFPDKLLPICAGGRGTVSLLLLDKGFDCVLVEPRDHKFNPKKMKKLNLSILFIF
jgi:hypothetical protein